MNEDVSSNLTDHLSEKISGTETTSNEHFELLPHSDSDQNLDLEFKKIPDQMAFKIGDVADLVQVKPYVLRYWEQEFKSLNPKKAINNQRIYSRRDVETVILIKKFLYVDQFSIPGARKALKEYRETKAKVNSLTKDNQLNSKNFKPINLSGSIAFVDSQSSTNSAELLTEKYIKIEDSISKLISKIRSVRGKLEHKFHQIGI